MQASSRLSSALFHSSCQFFPTDELNKFPICMDGATFGTASLAVTQCVPRDSYCGVCPYIKSGHESQPNNYHSSCNASIYFLLIDKKRDCSYKGIVDVWWLGGAVRLPVNKTLPHRCAPTKKFSEAANAVTFITCKNLRRLTFTRPQFKLN